jgi:pimeloyl-ACP methyl ester carboxylesterase
MLKWFITPIVVYGAFVALVYVAQRLLQYFPERRRTAPAAIGLADAEEVALDTADGERVIVWHVPPRNGQPVFVYFHGNGGSLRWREERFRDLIDDGSGLVALSYRGYGGSSGRPTEKGLIEDAKATYAFAVARYAAERLVLWGESLGSALAIALAADNRVGSRAGGSLYLSRRRWRAALLVCAGAALDEGPVSLGFVDRQSQGAGAGGSRRERHGRSYQSGGAILRSGADAEALRARCPRRAQRSWCSRGDGLSPSSPHCDGDIIGYIARMEPAGATYQPNAGLRRQTGPLTLHLPVNALPLRG